MKITTVHAVYFSATGNTEKAVKRVAEAIARAIGVPLEVYDFTFPESRESVQKYGPEDLVVIGTPVYAGRVPNKMLPYIQTGLQGEKTPMIPIVTFGNRSYDNALIELVEELGAKGFRSIAGACVPSEHAFIAKLAAGRPDSKDLEELSKFASKTAEKLMALSELPAESIHVPGKYPAPYYKPLGADGKPAVFLKAKPKTDEDKCDRCGTCESMCPMGSISKEDPMMVDGVCIKCQACVRKCPRGAKYFDDPDFLSHVEMLKENYAGRKEAEYFI